MCVHANQFVNKLMKMFSLSLIKRVVNKASGVKRGWLTTICIYGNIYWAATWHCCQSFGKYALALLLTHITTTPPTFAKLQTILDFYLADINFIGDWVTQVKWVKARLYMWRKEQTGYRHLMTLRICFCERVCPYSMAFSLSL